MQKSNNELKINEVMTFSEFDLTSIPFSAPSVNAMPTGHVFKHIELMSYISIRALLVYNSIP